MIKSRLVVGAVALIVACAGCPRANADTVLNFGSTFGLSVFNAPNTATEFDTLTAGTTTVDGGTLSLNIASVPAAGGAEWEVFTFSTTSGGPIGTAASNWEILLTSVALTQTFHVTHFFLDWGTNGTLFSPTTNTGNLSVETNPITGSGNVLGESLNSNFSIISFSGQESPFGALTADGFTVGSLNEFQAAFEVAVPGPIAGSGLPGLIFASGGLLAWWRRKRKAQAALSD